MALLIVCVLAQGGPPLRTDDPGTPGDGRWEINLAVTLESIHDRRLFEAPILDANYGLGDRIQLKVEVPWLVSREEGDGDSGLGKPLVGVKWRFLDADESGASMSIYPQLEFDAPRSSRQAGLVDRGTDLLLPVELRSDLGPVALNLEAGYLIREENPDEWILGLAAGACAADGLELIGEIHAETRFPIRGEETLVNVGCRWSLSTAHTLLFSIGRSLSDEPNLSVYLGLQFCL